MTTLHERRSHTHVIAGVLVLAFAFAAVRGASNAPALAVVMGLLAAGSAVGWVVWMRRPLSQLRISDRAITWGSPTKDVMTLERDASGMLHFHQNVAQQSGWVLRLADNPDGGGISMIGFDLNEVARACGEHGWQFR
jgi:hypothetical protein